MDKTLNRRRRQSLGASQHTKKHYATYFNFVHSIQGLSSAKTVGSGICEQVWPDVLTGVTNDARSCQGESNTHAHCASQSRLIILTTEPRLLQSYSDDCKSIILEVLCCRHTLTAVLVWKCLHGAAPSYLADLCVPCMVASNCVPRRLGLCWSRAPGLLPVNAASPSTDHGHGTVCQPILEHQIRPSAPSSVISRPTCFSSSLRCCWQVGSAPFVRRRCVVTV